MILDTIVKYTRDRVADCKKQKPLEAVKTEALKLGINKRFAFKHAISNDEMSFICEVKKASPSKGIITDKFDYLAIAKEYEEIGASAISVLTEPEFFKGSDRYLTEIKEQVNIPVLRKDFIIDEYQIYEAKIIGADAILLICAILTDEQLKNYLELAHSLGMSALVEVHNAVEINRALRVGAGIIGVNNRDLTNFHVDTDISVRLSSLIPEHIIFVSESGIRDDSDMEKVRRAGADAVLIGEAFIRSDNREEMIKGLRKV